MNKPYDDKRTFYRRPEVVAGYDQQRFGGKSGLRVNQRELETIDALLPPPETLKAPVLDLACGTGRLSVHLLKRGYDVVALDSSPAMLEETRRRAPVRTILGDAFNIPVDGERFAAAVMLRLAFHYRELDRLLAEVRRVTMPGGSIIFDTYRWTPRALVALGRQSWGGKINIQGPTVVAAAAEKLGLQVAEMQPCFLVSPYVYRLLPFPVSSGLERFERLVPQHMLSRIFWKLQRP